jgi:hypothetical protein
MWTVDESPAVSKRLRTVGELASQSPPESDVLEASSQLALLGFMVEVRALTGAASWRLTPPMRAAKTAKRPSMTSMPCLRRDFP